jgi:hypothetical protein
MKTCDQRFKQPHSIAAEKRGPAFRRALGGKQEISYDARVVNVPLVRTSFSRVMIL